LCALATLLAYANASKQLIKFRPRLYNAKAGRPTINLL